MCCMYYDCSYIFLFYFLFSSQYSLSVLCMNRTHQEESFYVFRQLMDHEALPCVKICVVNEGIELGTIS